MGEFRFILPYLPDFIFFVDKPNPQLRKNTKYIDNQTGKEVLKSNGNL